MEDFDKLYKLYNKKIYSYLLYLCKDSLVAEELLQETFYLAIKNIEKFRGESMVSTWIYSISKNVYLSWLRDKKKRDNIHDYDLNNKLVQQDKSDERIIQEEELRELFKLIDKIEEPYREVILMRAVNKLSYREISEIMKRKESWVRVIFHRGKVKLKALIENKGEI